MKTNVTSQFSVNFYFGKAADLTDNTVETTDAATGCTVTKLYGRVTIGDKPGDAYVMIRAIPYSDSTFNTVYGAYLIHIPQIEPHVALTQDTIKAYLGTEIALSTATVTDDRGTDITDKYTLNITAKATNGTDNPEGTLFHYVGDKHKIASLDKEGTFALHYAFTPKDATQYAGYQQNVPVTIIKASGIKPTTVSFPHEVHSIRLTDSQVKLDTAIVRDDLGNDVTNCFKITLSIKSDPKHICQSFWTNSNNADAWTMQTNGSVQGPSSSTWTQRRTLSTDTTSRQSSATARLRSYTPPHSAMPDSSSSPTTSRRISTDISVRTTNLRYTTTTTGSRLAVAI